MRKSTICKPSTANGMTLIELLMTLSIVAVIVALIASGDFRKLINDTWGWFWTSNIQGNLQLAKTEAVTRNTLVVLCASSNASSANPTCSGTSNNGWKDGFIMFTNTTSPNANNYDGGSEVLLRVGDSMRSQQQITAPSHYIFYPDGTIEYVAPPD